MKKHTECEIYMMKQEHKFCAELYHHLHRYIDHEKDVWFCLDGQAAIGGFNAGCLKDALLPDLVFTLKGSDRTLRIEAKELDRRGRVPFYLDSKQKTHWIKRSRSDYRPQLWVARAPKADTYYVWRHRAFIRLLSQAPSATTIQRPEGALELRSVRALAEAVRMYASTGRFC